MPGTQALVARLRSGEFLLHAAHPDHPGAFTRQRKLPLPALVALLLSGMRKSIQSELDEFFAHLSNQAQLARLCLRASFRPGAWCCAWWPRTLCSSREAAPTPQIGAQAAQIHDSAHC